MMATLTALNQIRQHPGVITITIGITDVIDIALNSDGSHFVALGSDSVEQWNLQKLTSDTQRISEIGRVEQHRLQHTREGPALCHIARGLWWDGLRIS